jgi:hypothetical protein
MSKEGSYVSKVVREIDDCRRLLRTRPVLFLLILVVFMVGLMVWVYDHGQADQRSGLSMNQVINHSPNSVALQAETVNIHPMPAPPRHGLYLLNKESRIVGNQTITRFDFGCETSEEIPVYRIHFKFQRKYDLVKVSFRSLIPGIEMRGGLDGEPASNQDKTQYTVGGRDLRQNHLQLEFSAPYKMEVTQLNIFPSPQ